MSYYCCAFCSLLINEDNPDAPMIVGATSSEEGPEYGRPWPYHVTPNGGLCGPLHELRRSDDMTRLREQVKRLRSEIHAALSRMDLE